VRLTQLSAVPFGCRLHNLKPVVEKNVFIAEPRALDPEIIARGGVLIELPLQLVFDVRLIALQNILRVKKLTVQLSGGWGNRLLLLLLLLLASGPFRARWWCPI
jgi:hypothetical protein